MKSPCFMPRIKVVVVAPKIKGVLKILEQRNRQERTIKRRLTTGMERKGKERNIQTRSFHFVILMENMMEGHIIKRLVLTLNVENLAILFKIVQK